MDPAVGLRSRDHGGGSDHGYSDARDDEGAADYHPDDPNPGMLDPAVRQTVLKTNGVAPNSTGCFGDSGGPIILLKPTFACVTPNPQGSLTAIYGYQNDNGVGISIPYGSKNASVRDASGLRPTRFDPGLHPFAFGVDFTGGQTASWTLAPDNNPSVTVNATSTSPRCTAAQAVDSGCVLQCRAQLRSGCPRVEESDNCVAFCADIGHSIANYGPPFDDTRVAWQNCVNATAPGAANWSCTESDYSDLIGKGPQAVACASLQDAYINCLFYGYCY